MAKAAYLGDRIGRHETEDVALDTLVEEDHVLELAGLKRVADTRNDLATTMGDIGVVEDVVHVGNELSTELMIDVKFTGRRGSKVGCCQLGHQSKHSLL
jgi:hypothetical protein